MNHVKLSYRKLIPYSIYLSCTIVLFVFTSQSQISKPFTFGYINELKSIPNSIGIISGDFNGDQCGDLAVYNRNKIKIFYQQSDSFTFLFRIFNFNGEVTRIFSAELNNDKYSDLICMGGKPLQLQAYIIKRRLEPILIWEKVINESYNDLIIGDINSDSKMDLILFGKKELGLMILLGKGNATFRLPQLIFPDYSFSKIEITDLNNDGINDIAGIDWIENKLLIFTGFGNLVFSDPVHINLNGQPEILRIGDFNGDKNIDLFIYSPVDNFGSIYIGNGLGNFNEHQNVRFTDNVLNVLVADVNNDLKSDLLILDKEENLLDIFPVNETGFIINNAPFYAVQNIEDITLFTHQRTKFINTAILDAQNKIIKIFYNANVRPFQVNNLEYAVGLDPEEVKAIDLNNDGWDDIVVANRKSKTYSIFLNDKSGYYHGQWSLPTLYLPENIFIPENQKKFSYIFSSSSVYNELNITEIDLNHFDYNHSKINFQVYPRIIGFNDKNNSNGVSLFIIEQDIGNHQNYLSEFIVGSKGKYSESTLEFDFDGTVIATSGLEILKDSNKAIWCIAYNDSLHRENIYKVILDTNLQINKIKSISSYEVVTSVPSLIISADLNNDDQSDCIVSKNDTSNCLLIYLDDNGTETKTGPNFIMKDIKVASSQDIKVIDIDKNGKNDIVVNDKKRRSLDAYLGLGYGRFSETINLASTAGWGGFDIADIENDNHLEIIFTNKFRKTLTIIPLPRF